ncbi:MULTISPECIES: ATP-binding protein [unclassified Planococcus (in: firmicutes)]|uniref:ATP-binding protein n=1 Tax=unclassified Planococcus (in: firmicutes) TaxID=2662419 RepID=UPI000C33E886|nr:MULTISPECIES: ATP-binding protein [unclassified Planococcus (in: firmicutes)]AUD14371.1 response regulator receiver protein [Planococcus sp. MB-3u-03]PKG46672.1 response regulator receiver protein [Planococcus sp. Urea-trap-24]PKG89475.1 response regulator receiver protein [Planococcus sp. Urea-3u-39]PKH42091.1 response regulator receiver protein [Planococcus sp. MB-3u-09]
MGYSKRKINSALFFFLVCCMALSGAGMNTSADSGNLLVLDDSQQEVAAGSRLSVLEDESGNLQIEDIQQPPHAWNFMPASNNSMNIGFSSSVYWLMLEVENMAHAEKEWLLELGSSGVDQVSLYTDDGEGGFTVEQAGQEIGSEIIHRTAVFPIAPPAGESAVYWMRVESSAPIQLPVTVWDREAFESQTRQQVAFVGVLGGLGLMFLFYYIHRFTVIRQRAYLYFVIYAITAFFLFSSAAGLSLDVIWPELDLWNGHSVFFMVGLAALSVTLLTEGLLNTKRHLPETDRMIKSLLIFNAVVLTTLFISLEWARLLVVLALSSTLAVSLLLAAYGMKRGLVHARYYAVSLIFFSVAAALNAFYVSGILPITMAAQGLIFFLGIFAVLFAALALRDKEKIREQERLQRERNSTERQRIEIERLRQVNERKDELLAITSHSLRTPLYGMVGIAESLQESSYSKMPHSVIQQLETISESGKKLARMINETLDFSGPKHHMLSLHLEKVKLPAIADSVIRLCTPLLKSSEVNLKHTIPADFPEVIADPERVRQVLYNLVGNAVEHTDSGEIIITAKIIKKQVAITVKDTGSGMEEQQLDSLFDPIGTSTTPHLGIGMGLKITKRLVEMQGGWLKAESAIGKGSSFTFTLPLTEEQELETVSPTEIRELTASQLADSLIKEKNVKKGLRILVVEAEEVNRLMLVHQLKGEGYKAEGVSCGEEALVHLENRPADLVILDDELPDMAGDELCRRIRVNATLTELPILMLSDKEGVREKTNAFSAGANDYLVKPCDVEEFLMRVETLATLRSMTQEITNLNFFLERNVKERTMALEITNMNLLTVNDEIQEVEKSRNEMLSAISHELGTPITLIHSYIQAVKESLIEENNPRYLDMIHKKLLLLERLTEDLVELSKYKSGNMTLRFAELKLDEWLERIAASMEADLAQSGRRFRFERPSGKERPADWRLLVDVDRVDQVFSNLLWNAVKHTSPEEGRITLSASIRASANILDETEADGELIIRVEDNGCGIQKEALPHIFDRFFKIDESIHYKGSGLGLAIAKEIIQSHKGEIWAESEEGAGSTFIIALPLRY